MTSRPRSAWSAPSVLLRVNRLPSVINDDEKFVARDLDTLSTRLRLKLFLLLFSEIASASESCASLHTESRDESVTDVKRVDLDDNIASDEAAASEKNNNDSTTNHVKFHRKLSAFHHNHNKQQNSRDKALAQQMDQVYFHSCMKQCCRRVSDLGLKPSPTPQQLLGSDPSHCLRALDWLLYTNTMMRRTPSTKQRSSIQSKSRKSSNTELNAKKLRDRSIMHRPEWIQDTESSFKNQTGSSWDSTANETPKPSAHETGDLASMTKRDLFHLAKDLLKKNSLLESQLHDSRLDLERILRPDYARPSSRMDEVDNQLPFSNGIDQRRLRFMTARMIQLEKENTQLKQELKTLKTGSMELETILENFDEALHLPNEMHREKQDMIQHTKARFSQLQREMHNQQHSPQPNDALRDVMKQLTVDRIHLFSKLESLGTTLESVPHKLFASLRRLASGLPSLSQYLGDYPDSLLQMAQVLHCEWVHDILKGVSDASMAIARSVVHGDPELFDTRAPGLGVVGLKSSWGAEEVARDVINLVPSYLANRSEIEKKIRDRVQIFVSQGGKQLDELSTKLQVLEEELQGLRVAQPQDV